MKNPPAHLRKILWEYDVDTLEKKNEVVLERVLSLGNQEDITYIGISRLKRFFLQKKPRIDPKSYNFWAVIFGTDRSSLPPSFYELINHPTPRRSFRQ